MKLNPSVPLETQLRNFERKVDFMEMRQYENPLQVYRNHADAPRCPKLQKATIGGAPLHRVSAVGTSTRTQQAPGNNFRLRVNLVDGNDQIPDPTPAEVGESEVMHIHDLVDKSYVDSEDELMETEQGPANWEEEISSN
ncbi:hypothetical protein SARC_02781 [Sphaeroforma arctica JP610]|uniref:Uncharacterized protein n=1 Tax=Sphaeroforma arctica JP610 TaxID=667725 RepID=A0A0L0G7L4_9EUKA|nr:hypothetical protein SARC_02781 [Sphaeroforma arctica JP610]KNC85027.1 hypothetical protein SARC_02781 [Sphaeroforma arctica JP610]|eukprot:XP_014158929.1 hypothetical protein SARC_02781 [Sphaeroforma arctica JP610]